MTRIRQELPPETDTSDHNGLSGQDNEAIAPYSPPVRPRQAAVERVGALFVDALARAGRKIGRLEHERDEAVERARHLERKLAATQEQLVMLIGERLEAAGQAPKDEPTAPEPHPPAPAPPPGDGSLPGPPAGPEQRQFLPVLALLASLLSILRGAAWTVSRQAAQPFRHRVPVVRQMSEVECGLASLAMVLSYHGRHTSLSELRTRYGTGRDGLSALAIVRAARQCGLRVRALSLTAADLRLVALPAIAHWEFNHFLVIERWSPHAVDVVDPAVGRRRLTAEEFDAGFTGVVIVLEPGVDFDRGSVPAAPGFFRFVLQYVRQAPGTFAQIVAVSLLLLLLGLMLPLLTKAVVDRVLPGHLTGILPVLGIGIVALFLAQGITTLLRAWLLVYLRARIDIRMMLGFVEHLLALPYSFFQQRSTGDLLTRLASNTILREALSNQLLSAVLDSGLVTVYLVILLWQSLPFGLLTLGIGVVEVLLLLLTNRPVGDLARRELAAFGKTQGYLAEVLTGIATLKASGAEQRAFDRWTNLFFDHLNISVRYNYVTATLTGVLTVLPSFAGLGLLWVGATQVLNGTISLGTMVALIALAGAFFAPLASLVTSGQQFQIVGANLDRIRDVTEAEREQRGRRVVSPPMLAGRIELRNVGFRYSQDGPNVLHNLTFTIEPGETVAIVGPSGSGKSTLGKLLLALYLPTAGEIRYDGIPLQDLNWQELRAQFGVVLQESALFSGSILSNITLSSPIIDREQVADAARIAAIDGDIMSMPMGYDTFVSEGGSALSGGQRQRLAIARAVAHGPRILLLDEATSHLDVLTEHRVAEHLRTLACTQIIIAHRLSTIRKADTILVLDRGAVVEQGSHDELVRRGAYYARLMQQQIEQARE